MENFEISRTINDLSTFDLVDSVLQTDDTFERAMTVATTESGVDGEAALNILREEGDIIDARDDESEGTECDDLDLSNVVDLCTLDDDGEDEYDDSDGELIDEVISNYEDESDPLSPDNIEDDKIIDAVENNYNMDNTGYQMEFGYSLFESCYDSDNSSVDMSDEDDEIIVEDL